MDHPDSCSFADEDLNARGPRNTAKISFVFQNKLEREPETEARQNQQNESDYTLPIPATLDDWEKRHNCHNARAARDKRKPKLTFITAPDAQAWNH